MRPKAGGAKHGNGGGDYDDDDTGRGRGCVLVEAVNERMDV